MRYRLRTLLIVLAIGPPTIAFSENDANPLVAKARLCSGYDYKCDEMARIVNYLRAQGKDRAIRLLRDHYDQLFEHGQDEEIYLICRCLFNNPQGWSLPELGNPGIPDKNIKHIPEFPLMFSNDVPFFVIEGYSGRTGNPKRLLDMCESLPLRHSAMPTNGFAAAARSLVSSKEFAELYPDETTRQNMSAMILAQAAKEN